jgi:hypothetical protein
MGIIGIFYDVLDVIVFIAQYGRSADDFDCFLVGSAIPLHSVFMHFTGVFDAYF